LTTLSCHALSTETISLHSQYQTSDKVTNIIQQNDSTWHDFAHFVTTVERLKNTSPDKAFSYLARVEHRIAALPLGNQLTFFKIKAELYQALGEYSLSKSVADHGLALAKTLASPNQVIVELLYARGSAIKRLGDLNGALAEFTNGLEIAEGLNNKKYVAIGLVNLGSISYLMEKFEQALTVFNDAFSLALEIDEEELKGYTSKELGILYGLLGKTEKSMIFYQQSYMHYQKAGKQYSAHISLLDIAFNHSVNQRFEQAIVLYKKVLANKDTIGDPSLLAAVYSGMAWAQLNKADKDEQASSHYMQMAQQYSSTSQQYDVEVTHRIGRGYLLIKLKDYEKALILADEALENMGKYTQPNDNYAATISFINLLLLKAEAYYNLGDFEQAYLFQSQLAQFSEQVRERANIGNIDDLRIRYESEQADLTKKILEQEKALQNLLLVDSRNALENRKSWLVLVIIISIVLAWSIVAIVRGQNKLFNATIIDELTGLNNRRHLLDVGNKYIRKIKGSNKDFSLLMINIDGFKVINDRFGEQLGDEVLRKVAIISSNLVRRSHCHELASFGRFGGEQFLALLPEVNNEQARNLAEQIRLSIEKFHWQLNTSDTLETEHKLTPITVSISISTYGHADHNTFQQLINWADNTLYQENNTTVNKVLF
jgi:diguanylate cyclase (GGDEF)-like protein